MTEDGALRSLRAFIFDMDGVIYRGNTAIPGAAEFVAGLRSHHIPFMFVTNNSSTPGPQVAERLRSMGIPAEPNEVLTSAEVTAAVLAQRLGRGRILLVGEEGIRQALLAKGFELTEDYRAADAVVVGIDRTFTYDKLKAATLAVRRGVPFIATNNDASLPTELGQVPGAGAVLIAIETASSARAEIIGKPEPALLLHALERMGQPRETTANIGDRPENDTVAGQAAGVHTIGVLTGVGTREGFAALQPPAEWVFDDLYALAKAYF